MRKITAVIKQCRLFFVILPLIAIASAFVAAENYNLTQLLFTSVSLIFGHCFTSSLNFTFDVQSDTNGVVMRSQNPLVTGELDIQVAWIINFVTPFLAIFTSLFVGRYWTIFILIAICLSLMYDLKPLRLKDTPFGVLITPLYSCLPFLFSYMNSSASLSFPPTILFAFVFLFLNMVESIRHVLDFENDRKMGVRNFTAAFGVEATRRLQLIASTSELACLIIGVVFGYLSTLGLPLLLLSSYFKLNAVIKPAKALNDVSGYQRFLRGMMINTAAIMLSIVGKVFSIGVISFT